MPFTTEQFFTVFVSYNAAIWPMQVVAYALGFVALVLVWWGGTGGSRAVLLILAAMWAANGVAYHILHFASINPLAYLFGAAFLVQAVIFAASAASRSPPRFYLRRDIVGVLGIGLIVYAMLIYPMLGLVTGRTLAASPVFGVAPCPTTIFTLGLLALAQTDRLPQLAGIPIIWALVGSSAAALLSVPEDLGLAFAAAIMLVLLARPSTRTWSAAGAGTHAGTRRTT